MSISSASSKNRLLRALLPVAALCLSCPALAKDQPAYGRNPSSLDPWLARLVAAYPDTVAGFDANHLILKNGKRLILSDGRADKSFETLLNEPDIGDMFAFAYPAGKAPSPPAVNHDPGRVRVEALFRALYGDCRKGEVEGRMRSVSWVPGHGGGKVRFSTAQGAADALEAVSRELDRLPASFGKYLVPSAGTYNCRPIAKSDRMSMHAYGVAIDLNTRYSAYWQWAGADSAGHYSWSNQIPERIIAIFEKHGFIWGGRWYHFDTMHFEFRPELITAKP